MALHIGQREVRKVTIVDLEGQLVAGDEAASFRELIDVFIEESKIWILVNLKSVRTIDSSGLGVLVSAHLAIRKAEGAIKLVNASQRHINLLVLSKLATVFPNFDDEDQAIDSFLPKEQAGRHFDVLEFVRSEEGNEQPITESEGETDRKSPRGSPETSDES
jgi:anti-sigma B factor antagonist